MTHLSLTDELVKLLLSKGLSEEDAKDIARELLELVAQYVAEEPE